MAEVNFLKMYREYTDSTESPRLMHLWTGISTLAAVMRRNYFVPFGHIKLLPYFYVVLVGPPGIVQKSTTLSFMTNLLDQVNGIHLAPDATSPQKLIQCLEEAAHNVTHKLQVETHHCLTIAASEFASIISGPDYETMITWLTDLYDREKRFKYQTKTRGDNDIPNPWVQIIACTTPSSLQQCLPINTVGDGLTSRIIFVFADKKDQLVSVPRAPSSDLVTKLVAHLEDIATGSQIFIFTDEALDWWHNFYTKDNEDWRPNDSRLQPYKARRHAHILKLAMVLAVNYGEKDLTLRCLEKAKGIIELTELNMSKAFGGLGENPNLKNMLKIASMLEDMGPLPLRLIAMYNHQSMSASDTHDLLSDMCDSGLLKMTLVDGERVYTNVQNPELSLLGQCKNTTELGLEAWNIILED